MTASWVFTGVGFVFFAGCLTWCLVRWVVDRDPIAMLALVGGSIASLEESWIDVQIKLWYPRDAPLVAFTANHTPQPLYLHLIYPGFVGLGAYYVYRGLIGSAGTKALWRGLVGIAVLDLVFELPATAAHVFVYYGHQPYQLTSRGWPAWVAPINGAGPVLGGWLLYALAPRLRGANRWLIALLPPLAYAGVYGAAGWPMFTMLNSHVPGIVRWLAGVVVAGLCVSIVKLLSLAMPTPVDRRESPAIDAPKAEAARSLPEWETVRASGLP